MGNPSAATNFGDVGASDSSGRFEKVELTVRAALYELGVRYPASQAQRRDNFAIEGVQRPRIR